MPEETSFLNDWIRAAKEGDQVAISALWEHSVARVVKIARSRMGNLDRRVYDEEDAAQSVMKSFLRGLQQDKFPTLEEPDDLWGILTVITGRKISKRRRHELAQKRGSGDVRGESVFGELEQNGQGIAGIAGREPAPEVAAEMVDECERLLDGLPDDRLREVAALKLMGVESDEIARRLDCSERTVRRRLTLIRMHWEESPA